MATPRFSGGKLSRRMDCDSVCSAPPPAPCRARATRMKPSVGAAPHANDDAVKMATQMMKKRLRPIRIENQFEAGSRTALAPKELVSTHVASSVEADSEPAMYGRATEAIAVSRTSMNVASMTE